MMWLQILVVLVLYADNHRKTRILRWCDGREACYRKLFEACSEIRYLRAPEGSFDAFFMKLPDGRRVLSKNGVENAHLLVDQVDAMKTGIKAATQPATDAVESLVLWERAHPLKKWIFF